MTLTSIIQTSSTLMHVSLYVSCCILSKASRGLSTINSVKFIASAIKVLKKLLQLLKVVVCIGWFLQQNITACFYYVVILFYAVTNILWRNLWGRFFAVLSYWVFYACGVSLRVFYYDARLHTRIQTLYYDSENHTPQKTADFTTWW